MNIHTGPKNTERVCGSFAHSFRNCGTICLFRKTHRKCKSEIKLICIQNLFVPQNPSEIAKKTYRSDLNSVCLQVIIHKRVAGCPLQYNA